MRVARGLIDNDIARLELEDRKKLEGNILPKGPITVLWTIQTSGICIVIIALGAMFWKLKFVMVPLLMAYFFTYMMGPLMDLLEKRPYGCFGPCGKLPEEPNIWETTYGQKMLCSNNYMHPDRAAIVQRIRHAERSREHHGVTPDDGKLIAKDIVLLAKMPHMLACVLTLLVSFGTLGMCAYAIQYSFEGFAEDDARQKEETGSGLSDKIWETLNNVTQQDLYDTFGIRILLDEKCVDMLEDAVIMQEQDKDNNYIMNAYVFGFYPSESQMGAYVDHGLLSNSSCDLVPTFPANPEGTPLAELGASVNAVMVVVNDLILMLLLAVFILLERPEGSTFKADHKIMFQIENMVNDYISLKSLLSLGTGVVCGIFLFIGSVKLWPIWALLAFLLNYIPNVGSAMAMILPMPFIFLDEQLAQTPWKQYVAAGGMFCTEMYVGNVLEPAMFGSSLNLTEISVLLSLVFCSYLWGIYGAVLSVPLLGVWKIVAHNVDHPVADSSLSLIRADVDVDIQKDKDEAAFFKRLDELDNHLDDLFHPDKAVFDSPAAEPPAAEEEVAMD